MAKVKLSKEEIFHLQTLYKQPQYPGVEPGWWEFRDGRKNDSCRNGILFWQVLDNLKLSGYVEEDEMAWNLTYVITNAGKEVAKLLEKN